MDVLNRFDCWPKRVQLVFQDKDSLPLSHRATRMYSTCVKSTWQRSNKLFHPLLKRMAPGNSKYTEPICIAPYEPAILCVNVYVAPAILWALYMGPPWDMDLDSCWETDAIILFGRYTRVGAASAYTSKSFLFQLYISQSKRRSLRSAAFEDLPVPRSCTTIRARRPFLCIGRSHWSIEP